MNQVQEATKALITAIEQSKEYINYQKSKQEISRYPILEEQMNEFRKRNYELQNSQRDIWEEADRLRQEYESILKNAVVREFLDAENAFCRVIQKVNWQLLEHLDFESGFHKKEVRKADSDEC